MTEYDQALVQQLCEENPHFRKLHEEHVFSKNNCRKWMKESI